MAKSITTIKRKEIPREVKVDQDMQEVKEAISDNKDSILKGIQLLKTLDEGGTLDSVNALSKHKKEAIGYFAKELNKPQYSQVLENLADLVFLLGDIDVKAMRQVTDRVNQGLEAAETEEVTSKTSFLDLAKALKDPEINRSITMMLQFLKGMGKQ
ncbi:DUF1641 domain-containing protein [Thalassobacillus hwangdonensis]|uniref:DUF1641 domain-containing protein n=1 Tax=Thalassobacillus hwangdonensis TaxID=546108 RepID=A0ABW3KYQ7_9BACI